MKIRFLLLCISVVVLSNKLSAQNRTIYRSAALEIDSIAPGTYLHRTFMQTREWGKVPCNGAVYVENGEAVVFDTPATDSVSNLLINWIKTHTHAVIKAIIVNHAHEDCLGGLAAFHQAGIPSYGSFKTIRLARASREFRNDVPQHGFEKDLKIKAGKTQIICFYPGEGHTTDNICCYIPSVKVLFGGCIIKASGAGKGNLAEANGKAWPLSVERIKNRFPEAEIIIPGHGMYGDRSLLDYTIRLFSSAD